MTLTAGLTARGDAVVRGLRPAGPAGLIPTWWRGGSAPTWSPPSAGRPGESASGATAFLSIGSAVVGQRGHPRGHGRLRLLAPGRRRALRRAAALRSLGGWLGFRQGSALRPPPREGGKYSIRDMARLALLAFSFSNPPIALVGVGGGLVCLAAVVAHARRQRGSCGALLPGWSPAGGRSAPVHCHDVGRGPPPPALPRLLAVNVEPRHWTHLPDADPRRSPASGRPSRWAHPAGSTALHLAVEGHGKVSKRWLMRADRAGWCAPGSDEEQLGPDQSRYIRVSGCGSRRWPPFRRTPATSSLRTWNSRTASMRRPRPSRSSMDSRAWP